MLFCQRVFISLIFLGCLAGCRLKSSRVKTYPIVGNSLSNVGHGQAVSVNVVDQRPSAIIGTRGGLYSSTSSITVQSNDIVPKLQKQAEEALSKMGYRPQSGSSTTLTIIIDSIVYTPSDSNFANDASVKAVLKAQLKTPSKTYNGKYSSTTSQGFTTAPSLEQNNAFVSDVLGNVLTNVFKDSNLSGSM